MTWQPIETAPRDGTTCLLWTTIERRVWWMTIDRDDYDDQPQPIVGRWWRDGWVSDAGYTPYGDSTDMDSCELRPTHWMPLPDPPKESDNG